MQAFFRQLQSVLPSFIGRAVDILSYDIVGGGCINQCYRLHTTCGSFFIKINHAPFSEDMFAKEASGLQILRETNTVKVPDVWAHGSVDSTSYLLLEYVEKGISGMTQWSKAGHQLAQLHSIHNEQYGLSYDNYIGSLPQRNRWHQTFTSFFIQERLEPQVRLAINARLLNDTSTRKFEMLYARLPDLLPVEPPSLLHGDLWNGNIFFDVSGRPVLVDPAIYFGHREAEIAFTRLFGGFLSSFYEAYEHHYPLQKGFEERQELYNLYPLLVHLNLFGKAYLHDILLTLQRYT